MDGNSNEPKFLDKKTSMAVWINGYYQRELVSTVLYFLTRYMHCVLAGEDPGSITLEVKAERLVGEKRTLHKSEDKGDK